eukprot:m.20217 g.20217  ORF g.20217 m.20217 type:complete len:194 (+) comp5226_c0_seq1:364-945(+)
MTTLKLIVVGDGAVGKSALTLQYMYAEFVEDYEPTKADSYRKTVNLEGTECTVDILDTAGQEDFAAIRDNYLRTGEGFLCVFSLTEQETFDHMEDFKEQIERVHDPYKMPIILVGNKADLVPQRNVTHQEAQDLASSWGVQYLETSAKNNTNVEEAFIALAKLVKEKKDKAIPAKGKQAKHGKSKKKSKCTIL